jgi:hypothetical protein
LAFWSYLRSAGRKIEMKISKFALTGGVSCRWRFNSTQLNLPGSGRGWMMRRDPNRHDRQEVQETLPNHL